MILPELRSDQRIPYTIIDRFPVNLLVFVEQSIFSKLKL